MEQWGTFLKSHGFSVDGVIATFIGALIAWGFLPKMTVKGALLVLGCGVATNTYVIPVVFWTMGWNPDTPLGRSAAFFAGLFGMRVIAVFVTAGEHARTPRDFLDIFLKGIGGGNPTLPPAPPKE